MTVWAQMNDWTYEYFELSTDPSAFPGAEKFVELWQHKRGTRELPKWSDYDWDDFAPWWGYLLVMDVMWDPYDFRFRLFGTEIVERFGVDVTGKLGSELTDGKFAQQPEDMAFYEMTDRGPYLSQLAGPVYWQNREYLNVRFVELPLSNTGERVTHELSLML